jgi:alpha-maltose-1-phosphate synthase
MLLLRVSHVRILLLAEGDPDSPMGSGSGTPASLAAGLRALGHTVLTQDIDIRGGARALTALRTWSSDRKRWVAKYHLSPAAFQARSRNAQRAVQAAGPLDAVLQYGATFDASGMGPPVYLFCDSNTLFSSQQPTSWGHALTPRQRAAAVACEGGIYRASSAIFTMSQYIADSFVADFGLPQPAVMRVGAGPNADPTELLAIARSSAPVTTSPTILFIGREFERKGGDVLVDAFERVRQRIPTARLLVAGPATRMPLPDGAEFLGFLNRTQPGDWTTLKRAFTDASVFTLPARHEPFGLVVLEAMYAGLPVVATNIGALREMVVDEITGYLVPPGDAESLAAALLRVLESPDAVQLGRAGRKRATDGFTWHRVTSVMAERMAQGR